MSRNVFTPPWLFIAVTFFLFAAPLIGFAGFLSFDLEPETRWEPGIEWPRQRLSSFPFQERCLTPVFEEKGDGGGSATRRFPPTLDRYVGEQGGQDPLADQKAADELTAGLSLDGEINLKLKIGGDFSLKKGSVPGAGSLGVANGLDYELIEIIRLEGNVQERLFVEFDYDSRRTDEGIGNEQNLYSVLYKGKQNEFVREASLGNKYQSIEGSRYIPIDVGGPDSFALRGIAGRKNLTLEGLFRYEEALPGIRRFQGFRKSVDFRVPDVSYVKSQYFMLPERGIDEPSLRLYSSVTQPADISAGGKDFKLLTRGVDFDYDNALGFVYLREALALSTDLIVYYEKGGVAVGDPTLGQNAIIVSDGTRTNFNRSDSRFDDEYFVLDSLARTDLYLKREAFNSYWELRNIYALPELEGQTVSDVTIEVLYTENGGVNTSYDTLIGSFKFDTWRSLIRFEFTDAGGRFYPRPFPGADPYDSTLAPYPSFPTPPGQRNPFDTLNPVYGGLNYPAADASISELRIKYAYEATSFFLDLNVVPGSVEVMINGVELDPSKYDVDNAMGVITFDTGAISPSSDVIITYKYSPFGGGEKMLFGAFGASYDTGPFRVKNLSAYRSGLPGQEAPEAGTVLPREFANTTEFGVDFEKNEIRKLYGSLDGGFAFALTNRNSYGSAIVADMERDESAYEFGMFDEAWYLATITNTSVLTSPPYNVPLATRGDVLYKNYWEKTVLEGDVLRDLSYTDPRVFAYSQKAGPYSVDEEFVEADDRALVIDYELPAGSANAFVSVVTPIRQENLSFYERFNMILEWQGVSDADVELYVELLGSYDEDLNVNSTLDGESSINDPGFAITPGGVTQGGAQTRFGSDRDGNSNGRLDSEDLNGNNVLDTNTVETGVIIPLDPNGVNDFYTITAGSQTWQFISINVNALIADPAKKPSFQYANALRITVRDPSAPSASTGKVVVDKIWFSGSGVFNESPDVLSISDASVDEDPEVRQDAFSKRYPGVYDELHGSPGYRSRNDHLEKTLKVRFGANPSFSGNATVVRRFGAPADLSFYREFKMYLYRPGSAAIPAGLDLILNILSSENEKLSTVAPIQSESLALGWNEISVSLRPPYTVKLNGTDATNLFEDATLQVLKRVSRIQFGFTGSSVFVPSDFTIWLDEWHVADSEGFFDKAYFAEGSVGYAGAAVTLGGFPLVQDPVLGVGVERQEGWFIKIPDYRSDRYFADVNATLFKALDSRFYLSREKFIHIRNKEDLSQYGLDTDAQSDTVSYDFILDLEKPYLPVLVHGYEGTMKRSGVIELTQTSYRHKYEDLENDTIELGERYNLPFGLTQFYTFQRRWQMEDKVTRLPPTFDIPSVEPPVAVLNQINDIYFSYGWKKGSLSLALKRDEFFSGTDVPDTYFDKMAKIFATPENALPGANLTLRTDRLQTGLNRPPIKGAGVNVFLTTDFTSKNFQPAGARDTLTKSIFSVAVPFYPTGNDAVQLTPGLERNFTADYRETVSGISEGEIVLATYGALFMPPFLYANRQKEYKAVDLYAGDGRIKGTSSNVLETKATFAAVIKESPWFVPSNAGIALYSQTGRQGGSYSQLRGLSSSLTKYISLGSAGNAFDRSLNLAATYKNERNFATKTVLNGYNMDTTLNLLAREWRGTRFLHSLTYERERQKLNDPDFNAFSKYDAPPESVAFVPYKDKIDSRLIFEYLWDWRIRGGTFLNRIWKNAPSGVIVENTERAILENIYTFTDREKAGSYSNVPVRLTLEHLTNVNVSEHLEFELSLKGVAGVEERVLVGSPQGNDLVSAGLELGIMTKIIF